MRVVAVQLLGVNPSDGGILGRACPKPRWRKGLVGQVCRGMATLGWPGWPGWPLVGYAQGPDHPILGLRCL